MAKAKIEISSHQIIDLIRTKHPAPEWAVFGEMRTTTGWGERGRSPRSMDAWVMNTWKNKRYRTIAYEVKVTRADFVREIEDPAKREQSEELAGECYFAMPAGLVKPDEVPEGWGLAVVHANGLVVKKKARQRKVTAWPIGFIAALARRAADPTPTRSAKYIIGGKEVSDEELSELLIQKAPELLRVERAKIAEEAARGFQEAVERATIFADHVAKKLSITKNAYSFDRWFDAQTKHGVSENDKRTLETAHHNLTLLLDKLNEQAKQTKREPEESAAE